MAKDAETKAKPQAAKEPSGAPKGRGHVKGEARPGTLREQRKRMRGFARPDLYEVDGQGRIRYIGEGKRLGRRSRGVRTIMVERGR